MSHCHRDIHNVTFFFCPIIHHCVSVQEREKSISFDKNNRAIKRPNWVQVGYYRFYKIHLKNKISKIMVWFGSYSSDRQRDVYTSDSRLMTIWRVTRIRNKCKSTFRWRRAWKKKGEGEKEKGTNEKRARSATSGLPTYAYFGQLLVKSARKFPLRRRRKTSGKTESVIGLRGDTVDKRQERFLAAI